MSDEKELRSDESERPIREVLQKKRFGFKVFIIRISNVRHANANAAKAHSAHT